MSWQERILNKLNIRKDRSQLILDKTGVLVHKQFLDYIEDHSYHYELASSLIELLTLIKDQGRLVISSFVEVPSYVSGKTDIKKLDYQQLPLEIEYSIAKTLDADNLISLLAYRDHTGEINHISEINVNDELYKALRFGKERHVVALKQTLQKSVKTVQGYEQILELGKTWGEYIYACFESNIFPDVDLMSEIDQTTEKAVLGGCLKDTFFVTERNLKTVNKIRSFLDQKVKESHKLALVCFDGMGVAEWILLKKYLSSFDFSFSEKYLFALVPTITKISRSSIFYGDHETVYSLKTPNEEKQFSTHYKNATCRFFREGDIQNEDHVLGIDRVVVIYNFLDDIAHETKFPPDEYTKFLYFKNLLTYLNRSKIKDELLLLKKLGYSIWICSDHGCVVGHGNGQRIDKYLIEESSKRATLITKTDLAQFYDVNHYEIPFLSHDRIALLAKDRTLFANKKYTGISHGGITLEELIVPFVEVVA